MRLRTDPLSPIRSVAVAALLAVAGASVQAQEVRLKSTDGLMDFSGTLISFEDGVYTIDTSMGRLSLPANEVSCDGDACPQVNQVLATFSVVGSPVMLTFLMPELLDNYSLDADTDIVRTEATPGRVGYQLLTFDGAPVADVSLAEATSKAAASELAFGDAALAILPGQLTEAEAALVGGGSLAAMGRQGFEMLVARDAAVVLVGEDAGIDALRPSELAAIFSGEVTNWSDLGGPDQPISVFTPPQGGDIDGVLTSRILGPFRKQLGGQVIRVDSSESVADAVQRFPNGIGIAAGSRVGVDRGVEIADACENPVAPGAGTVTTGRYPLGIDYYLYQAPQSSTVHSRGLADFAATDLGQELVASAGFQSLAIAPLAAPVGGYDGVTDGATQLGLTLRARGPGGRLDAGDHVDLDRLAAYVGNGLAEGQELIFVGVAGEGRADAALNGARAALRALFASHPETEEQLTVGFTIAGADAASPGAPCLTDLGNDIHVEVWARPLADG